MCRVWSLVAFRVFIDVHCPLCCLGPKIRTTRPHVVPNFAHSNELACVIQCRKQNRCEFFLIRNSSSLTKGVFFTTAEIGNFLVVTKR